jgi:hypothetical protein
VPRWNWLADVVLPACLVVGEATWVALLVNAAYNASHGPRVRLPFLVFAIAPVAALTAVALTGRLHWPWWRRTLLVAGIAVVGAAVTAGGIAALTQPGAGLRTAVAPWTSRAHHVATVAGAAWLVAVAAWVRGTWLGGARPPFARAVRSAAISAVALIGIFAGRAAAHDVAFRAATGDAGVLLFVFFPLTGTALLLIRQQELEHEALLRSSSGPGMAWLSVLGAPLLAIAGLCLLVTVAIGPAARGADRAGFSVLRAVGWVLAALGRLLRAGGARGAPVVRAHSAPSPAPALPLYGAPHVLTVPGAVWDALAAVAALVVVVVVVKYVRPFWPERRRPRRALAVDEERDSVFTWAHLRAQLAVALRRVLQRLLALLRPFRRRRGLLDAGPPGAGPAPRGGGAPLDGVRADYRRVLVAARRSGAPRAPAETAAEFEARLTGGALMGEPEALHDLTALYERARYGDATLTGPERQHAAQSADVVIEGLALTGEAELA